MCAEENALLRQILENPGDDTARLVMADWWDEHGQPERAEFCRVQCELAANVAEGVDPARHLELLIQSGYPSDHPTLKEWRRFSALSRRDRELLAVAHPEWLPPLPDGHKWVWGTPPGGKLTVGWVRLAEPISTVEFFFRRGFVESVTCTAAVWCGGPCGRCNASGHTHNCVECGSAWKINRATIDYPHETWSMASQYERPGSCCDSRQMRTNAASCSDCDGTGVTPALGPLVVAAQPVTGVVLTDRRPAHYSGQDQLWGWYGHLPDTPPEDVQDFWLPPALFDRLPTGVKTNYGRSDVGRRYPTEAAALVALSRACVDWARAEAGLSPIPRPTLSP